MGRCSGNLAISPAEPQSDVLHKRHRVLPPQTLPPELLHCCADGPSDGECKLDSSFLKASGIPDICSASRNHSGANANSVDLLESRRRISQEGRLDCSREIGLSPSELVAVICQTSKRAEQTTYSFGMTHYYGKPSLPLSGGIHIDDAASALNSTGWDIRGNDQAIDVDGNAAVVSSRFNRSSFTS